MKLASLAHGPHRLHAETFTLKSVQAFDWQLQDAHCVSLVHDAPAGAPAVQRPPLHTYPQPHAVGFVAEQVAPWASAVLHVCVNER